MIIFNPNEEIVRSIKSGDIIQYIQESWWLSIKRMGENSGIFVNGERVNLPDFIEYDNSYDLPRPETYQPGYRVKHFGLYVSKKGDNEWHGISYYRMGMKIGSVDVDDIPPSILVIILLSVIIAMSISSLILNQLKECEKSDTGIEICYWKLSYRRKFIRTLWLIPIGIILVFCFYITFQSTIWTFLVAAGFTIMLLVQAMYNYKKWKTTTE